MVMMLWMKNRWVMNYDIFLFLFKFLIIFFHFYKKTKHPTIAIQFTILFAIWFTLQFDSFTWTICNTISIFRTIVETNKHNNYVIIKNISSPSLNRCPFYLKFVSNYKIAKLEICTALKYIHFLYNNRLCNKYPTSWTAHHFQTV